MTAWWVLGCAAAGLLAGGALRGTVFAFSAPAGSPPRVRCPDCDSRLGRHARDGVAALVGALPPGGRCPRCRMRIGPPAALLEVATAVAFALVAVRYGPGFLAVAFFWLAAVGVALSAIDLAAHRLPDALTLPSYPVVFGLLALAAVTGGGGQRLLAALLGMAGLLALYLLLVVIPASAMGLGDVKLAGVLGLVLGWLGAVSLLVGVLAGTLLAAAAGVALIAAGRAGWRSHIPFGPFMLAGAFAVILW